MLMGTEKSVQHAVENILRKRSELSGSFLDEEGKDVQLIDDYDFFCRIWILICLIENSS
jgi:hypothetical protein